MRAFTSKQKSWVQLTITRKRCQHVHLAERIASIKSIWLNKDDTKSPNDEKFWYNEKINLLPYACPSKDIHSLFFNDFRPHRILVKCTSAVYFVMINSCLRHVRHTYFRAWMPEAFKSTPTKLTQSSRTPFSACCNSCSGISCCKRMVHLLVQYYYRRKHQITFPILLCFINLIVLPVRIVRGYSSVTTGRNQN